MVGSEWLYLHYPEVRAAVNMFSTYREITPESGDAVWKKKRHLFQ